MCPCAIDLLLVLTIFASLTLIILKTFAHRTFSRPGSRIQIFFKKNYKKRPGRYVRTKREQISVLFACRFQSKSHLNACRTKNVSLLQIHRLQIGLKIFLQLSSTQLTFLTCSLLSLNQGFKWKVEINCFGWSSDTRVYGTVFFKIYSVLVYAQSFCILFMNRIFLKDSFNNPLVVDS